MYVENTSNTDIRKLVSNCNKIVSTQPLKLSASPSSLKQVPV